MPRNPASEADYIKAPMNPAVYAVFMLFIMFLELLKFL